MQNSETVNIAANPDWLSAAANLVQSLSEETSDDKRVLILEKLARKLDGALFPAFLRIIYTVSVSSDEQGKALLRNTFLYALNCGLIPQGAVPAWGAMMPQRIVTQQFGGLGDNDTARSQQKPLNEEPGSSIPHPADLPTSGTIHRLGPIEYLCVWFLGNSELPTLVKSEFGRIMEELLDLFSADDKTRLRYSSHLRDVADHGPLGSLSLEARRGLLALAEAWADSPDGGNAVAAFHAATSSDRRLLDVSTNPFL